MNPYVNKRLVRVDSHNRLFMEESHTDFSFMIEDDGIKRNRICLMDISIPKSYYNVPLMGNTFYVIENGIERMISVPPANYSRRSLAYVVTNLLNGGDVQAGYAFYSISWPTGQNVGDDGKYVFSNSGGVNPSFRFSGVDLHEQLGFVRDTTYPFVGGELTSVSVSNLQPEATINVNSNVVLTSGEDVTLQTLMVSSSQDYHFITWTNPDPLAYGRYFNSYTNIFRIWITNEDNDAIINTNGLNCVMTFMLWLDNPFQDMMRDFIRHTIEKE